MQDARKFFHHDRPFAMHRGGTLPEFTLAWESWGTLNEARDNAVLILTGLSPDAHVAARCHSAGVGRRLPRQWA